MDANGFSTDDQTIIIDDVTTDQVISVNLLPSQHFEITGLTFRSGTGHGNNYHMLIQLKTNPLTNVNNNVRIHHNHFDSVARRLVVINGSNYGVIDHNQIAMVPGDQVAYWPFGSGGTGGHGQWADYAWFGTDKFLFIEDNYIKGGSGASARGVTDCEGALRYVLRHNHVIDGSAGDHGTEGGTTRGERASEMYDNVLEYTTGTTANMGTRGGNKLAHDNQITKSTIKSLGAINYYRGFGGGQGGTWGNADGISPWDKCVTDVDPGGEFPGLDQSKQHWIDGHLPAYLFYSGTASADDPATNRSIGTLIVSGSPWTVGQWVGYSVTQSGLSKDLLLTE